MDIDYKKQILYGGLQRMAPTTGNVVPVLKEYWVACINPKESAHILKLNKEKFQYTTEALKHLKRMKKLEDKLYVLICPVDDVSYTWLLDTLEEVLNDVSLEKIKIPMNKPFDKEINHMWSEQYWPLLWKGNPLVQDLNEIYKQLDITKITKYMLMLVELSKNPKSGLLPIVTVVVDPVNDEVISITHDERTDFDPIKHSVMDSIGQIATKELERRQICDNKDTNKYLCLNYHVYTTHEPCTMCSMALVHSRISQLVYLKESHKTGGIGKDSGHREMIHLSCALNWKFEAFKYIDTHLDSQVAEVDPDLYV